jgi:tRNA(fMet)-specific endonuclease VapC
VSLVLDTNILIHAERCASREGRILDFTPWASQGNAFISAITASELLVGVHRAESEARRLKRSAFVESVLAAIPILDFSLETARAHAEIKATLIAHAQTLGANALIIAAPPCPPGTPSSPRRLTISPASPGFRLSCSSPLRGDSG